MWVHTLPDYTVDLPDASRTVCVDVTVSAIIPGDHPKLPKRDIRAIYQWLSEHEPSYAGIVVCQQNLLTPENLLATIPIIEQLAYSIIDTPMAQAAIDLVANHYSHKLYRSDIQDWEEVAKMIRRDLKF